MAIDKRALYTSMVNEYCNNDFGGVPVEELPASVIIAVGILIGEHRDLSWPRPGQVWDEWKHGSLKVQNVPPQNNLIVNNVICSRSGILLQFDIDSDNTICNNLLYAYEDARIGNVGDNIISAIPPFRNLPAGDYCLATPFRDSLIIYPLPELGPPRTIGATISSKGSGRFD